MIEVFAEAGGRQAGSTELQLELSTLSYDIEFPCVEMINCYSQCSKCECRS
jgi:hypothetical protein